MSSAQPLAEDDLYAFMAQLHSQPQGLVYLYREAKKQNTAFLSVFLSFPSLFIPLFVSLSL